MKHFTLAGFVLSAFAATANASTITYYLDNTNVNPIMPDGTYAYLSVTLTDGVTFGSDTDAVQFDVTMLAPLLGIADTGSFGIDSFAFNTDLANPADSAIVGLPSGWSANSAPPPNTADGYGKFDIQAQDSNNPQNPTLTFYVSGVSGDTIANYYFPSSGDAEQGNSHYAAHVRGFVDQDESFCDDGFGNDTCVVTSAWFGDGSMTVVPVPGAVWLLGSALGVLGAIRRRA